MDCLAAPLADRLEEWRRTVVQLDRENNREWRRAKAELQRATGEVDKLNKRSRRKVSSSPSRTPPKPPHGYWRHWTLELLNDAFFIEYENKNTQRQLSLSIVLFEFIKIEKIWNYSWISFETIFFELVCLSWTDFCVNVSEWVEVVLLLWAVTRDNTSPVR